MLPSELSPLGLLPQPVSIVSSIAAAIKRDKIFFIVYFFLSVIYLKWRRHLRTSKEVTEAKKMENKKWSL